MTAALARTEPDRYVVQALRFDYRAQLLSVHRGYVALSLAASGAD